MSVARKEGEKGKRESGIDTVIIPELISNSGGFKHNPIVEGHPRAVLRPLGKSSSPNSHSRHHMGGKKQLSWQPRDL